MEIVRYYTKVLFVNYEMILFHCVNGSTFLALGWRKIGLMSDFRAKDLAGSKNINIFAAQYLEISTKVQ